jgi:hypothetical protein
VDGVERPWRIAASLRVPQARQMSALNTRRGRPRDDTRGAMKRLSL